VWLGGGPTRKLPLRGRPSSQTLPKGRGTWGQGGSAMIYLSNALSISMLPPQGATVRVSPLTVEETRALLAEGFESAVGHESTAAILSILLGVEVPPRRVAIKLGAGDTLIVFQLLTRLPEGAVLSSEEVLSLVQEGKAAFYKVEILEG